MYRKKLCDRLQVDFSKARKRFQDFMDDVSSHFAEDLAVFSAAIDTIPIKSADAERGFSTMNLICTPLRNRLGVERLSNLIFVSLVGPSLDYFNALQNSYINIARQCADAR